MNSTTEEERFEAISDEGRRYTVIKLQQWTTFQPLKGPAQRHKGAYSWKTSCGEHLNEGPSGTFKMALRDETLRRI